MSLQHSDKVLLTFGDSVTEAAGMSENWTNIVAKRLQARNAINLGVSGSTYCKTSWRNDSAAERCVTIKDRDIIVVWFGINDFHYSLPLGEFQNNDTTTLFGATDFTFKNLINNNPNASIVIMTPMKQHGYRVAPDSYTKNEQGLVQIDYVNAIKKVADYYSLPVLDMYANAGMTPFLDSQKDLYFIDGLHPNQNGQYRVARKVANFLEING